MPRNFTQKAMSLVVNQDTGTDTSDATAVASDIRQGKTAYGAHGKLTGTLVPLDTSDANAAATDIKTGKTAYVNGVKVTGAFADVDSSDANATAADIATGKTAYVGNTKIIGTHTCPPVLDTSDATATAKDIVAGETAYVNGVKITGTHTCPPGLDTSDATAVAGDIVSGKTAYVNGSKVTGSLPLFPNSRTFTVDNGGVALNSDDSALEISTINTTKQVLDSNVSMVFSANYSDVTTTIGLTADKIKSGETILGITGTYTGEAASGE